jgi:mannose-6-phosphate isomerase
MQWASSPHAGVPEGGACLEAADQLVEHGERWGVDEVRGVVINELWDDMTVKDSAAKLWPQTERVKAWCAILSRAQTHAEVERACGRIAAAARGMSKYLRVDVPGLWHEVCATEGHFPAGPTRASSLYHIACAVDVLTCATRKHLNGAAQTLRAKEAP